MASVIREPKTATADPAMPPPAAALLSLLQRKLIEHWQRDLPWVARPFAAMGERIGCDEAAVLGALRELAGRGILSRVGAVFRPNVVGASTLCAMAVPAGRLPAVAATVSGYPEVNHNYERDNRYNLWFVATAPDRDHLAKALSRIEAGAGLPVLSMPLLDEYHIDLGFHLDGSRMRNTLAQDDASPASGAGAASGAKGPDPTARDGANGPDRTRGDRAERPGPQLGSREDAKRPDPQLTSRDDALIAGVQGGLPLVSRPFAAIARGTGWSEAAVLDRLAQWTASGVVRRAGLILRHRPLGWTENAMAVWDVPDSAITERGRQLAESSFVTLCYRRARQLPQWRYNLYCMVHGNDRPTVLRQIAAAAGRAGLCGYPAEILFSRRAFKQCGARYRFAPQAGEAHG